MSVMQSKGCTFYTFITGQTYLPKFISSRSEKKNKKLTFNGLLNNA